MIKVHCRTNLDLNYPETWPTEFTCRPMIGDRVESESGMSLKIVGITHCHRGRWVGDPKPGESYLEIELNR